MADDNKLESLERAYGHFKRCIEFLEDVVGDSAHAQGSILTTFHERMEDPLKEVVLDILEPPCEECGEREDHDEDCSLYEAEDANE